MRFCKYIFLIFLFSFSGRAQKYACFMPEAFDIILLPKQETRNSQKRAGSISNLPCRLARYRNLRKYHDENIQFHIGLVIYRFQPATIIADMVVRQKILFGRGAKVAAAEFYGHIAFLAFVSLL